MCVVSAVIENGSGYFPKRWPDYDKWPDHYPRTPAPYIPWPEPNPLTPIPNGPSQAEFDQLRREVEELVKLVREAMKFDKLTGQANCEDPKKVKWLAELAKKAGVNIDDLIAELNK